MASSRLFLQWYLFCHYWSPLHSIDSSMHSINAWDLAIIEPLQGSLNGASAYRVFGLLCWHSRVKYFSDSCLHKEILHWLYRLQGLVVASEDAMDHAKCLDAVQIYWNYSLYDAKLLRVTSSDTYVKIHLNWSLQFHLQSESCSFYSESTFR